MSEPGSQQQGEPQAGAGTPAFALPPGYDGLGEARRLLRTIRAGALATLAPEGFPFASLVNVATDVDGAPLILTSALSSHTQHMLADSRASLLLSEGGKGDPLAHPRLTLVGRMAQISGAPRANVKARFLARHPKSALYADFGDFSFWRMEIARAHLNGGFAKAATYEGAAILLDAQESVAVAACESQTLERLNADPDGLRALAIKLCGAADVRWRASGLDPEGLDLLAGDSSARVVFTQRASASQSLESALDALFLAASVK
jgi:putative heme iron utilization protein